MVKISLPVFGQVEVQAFDGERGAIVRLPRRQSGELARAVRCRATLFIFRPSIHPNGLSG